MNPKNVCMCVKRVDIGFTTLSLYDASFFLKTISNIFKFVAELFLYLWKIIEYWNCFQMHNNSSRALEIWQRYSVDNYHYLWLGIKSLFPFYIIEYWITFLRKKRKNGSKKAVWHKKISFLMRRNLHSFIITEKNYKVTSYLHIKDTRCSKTQQFRYLFFFLFSGKRKVWAIDF